MPKAQKISDEFDAYLRDNPIHRGTPCPVVTFPAEVRELIEAAPGDATSLARFLQTRGFMADRPMNGARQTIRRHQRGECRCGPR